MGMQSLKHRIWALVYPDNPIIQDDVFRRQFLQDMARENLKRLWVIGTGLIFTESVIFLMPGELFGYKSLILVFLLMQGVLTLALTGVKQRLEHFSYAFLNFIQLTYFILYIFLAMGLSLLSQGKLDMVRVFIAGLVSLLIAFYIPFFTMTFLLLASLGIFLTLLPYFQPDPAVLNLLTSNVSVFIFLAWIIAVAANRSRLETYRLMKTLETKNRELEELNKRDTMTLLYNHASILSLIDEQVRLSRLDHSPMAMPILDLDDFKVVNDTYGHQKGDEVLLELAEILRQNTRGHDLVGRYGGEEFFVLFPQTRLEDAHRVSERIRQKIEETDFNGVHVTVSGGLSLYTGEEVDTFIRLTDDRLYQAKAQGKNRIITEDPKPA